MGKKTNVRQPAEGDTRNINVDTGIRYGVIDLNSIDDEIRNQLWGYSDEVFHIGLKDDLRKALLDTLQKYPFYENSTKVDLADEAVELITNQAFEDNVMVSEPDNRIGEMWGVKFEMNDRFYLVIMDSPKKIFCRLCSPCYPNAGNLDEPDINGFRTYDVPKEWRKK